MFFTLQLYSESPVRFSRPFASYLFTCLRCHPQCFGQEWFPIVLLPGDDPAAYEALYNELAAHFPTRDLTEQRFVREMADAEWRLRRTRAYMHSALSRKIAELAPLHPDADPLELQALAFEALHVPGSPFPQYLRYEAKYERQYDRAYRGWVTYQKEKMKCDLQQLEAALLAPPPYSRRPDPPDPAPAPTQNRTNEPNSAPPNTPRNAPCPCGSGQKYKRCCGRNTPGGLLAFLK